MHTYAVLLGHLPALTLAELRAVLPDMNDVRISNQGFALFSTKHDIDQKFLDHLGGSVIIAREVMHGDIDLEDIPALLAKEAEGIKGKVTFSLRAKGIARPQLKSLYRACKERLKQHTVPSRYIGNEHDAALPIQLHQNGIVSGEHGVELTILRDKNGLWIGRTAAAQNTRAYAVRDMEKPVRDMTAGILPPKLAQILLNFGVMLVRDKRGELPAALTILDPFCGSGVIPLEAMLRGFHVHASDIAPKAITGCQKNVDWARKAFNILKSKVNVTVEKHDARKAFSFRQPPDVIVSETSLGPNLRARPRVSDAEKFRKESEKLLGDFLKNTAKTLPGVPLVLTLPVWHAAKRPVRIECLGKLAEMLGYTLILPPETPSSDTTRPSLLYRRSDQFVAREIVLLAPR